MSAVLSAASGAVEAPGFFGKVPVKGDFVTRRLPQGFTAGWDAWLQAAMAESREQIGEEWLDIYLNAPLWHFALSPGACGEAAVAGLIMPSVDRVGRYFPLTVAAILDETASPAELAAAAGDWFEAVQDLALSALEDDFDFDAFDRDLAALELPSWTPRIGDGADDAPETPAFGAGWRVGIGPDGNPARAYAGMIHHILRATAPDYGLWWTAGSETVLASLLVSRGLPKTGSFAALLDGQWEQWGWLRWETLSPSAGPPIRMEEE
ncbi:MAG: type VI secretion system-associated protein TagF [Alphaproteobacteria bacterium]|nr:type VI secretion system-associated protein TagF [Alphaproteobacteria bacterium]